MCHRKYRAKGGESTGTEQTSHLIAELVDRDLRTRDPQGSCLEAFAQGPGTGPGVSEGGPQVREPWYIVRRQAMGYCLDLTFVLREGGLELKHRAASRMAVVAMW